MYFLANILIRIGLGYHVMMVCFIELAAQEDYNNEGMSILERMLTGDQQLMTISMVDALAIRKFMS